MLEPKPLIVKGQYRTLGVKAFWLLLAERLSPSIGFVIIALMSNVALSLGYIPQDFVKVTAMADIVLYGIFFVSLIVGFVWTWLVYSNHMFALDQDALKIKRGILTKVETAFPYRQIQHVEVERRLLFRMLGLARLMIITSANDNPKTERNEAEAVLPIIEKDVAQALQEELLRLTGVQRVSNTK